MNAWMQQHTQLGRIGYGPLQGIVGRFRKSHLVGQIKSEEDLFPFSFASPRKKHPSFSRHLIYPVCVDEGSWIICRRWKSVHDLDTSCNVSIR